MQSCPEKINKSPRCDTLGDYIDWDSNVYPSRRIGVWLEKQGEWGGGQGAQKSSH